MIMAKDGEVALSFQPLLGVSCSFFWGLMRGQVADPMIEALNSMESEGDNSKIS